MGGVKTRDKTRQPLSEKTNILSMSGTNKSLDFKVVLTDVLKPQRQVDARKKTLKRDKSKTKNSKLIRRKDTGENTGESRCQTKDIKVVLEDVLEGEKLLESRKQPGKSRPNKVTQKKANVLKVLLEPLQNNQVIEPHKRNNGQTKLNTDDKGNKENISDLNVVLHDVLTNTKLVESQKRKLQKGPKVVENIKTSDLRSIICDNLRTKNSESHPNNDLDSIEAELTNLPENKTIHDNDEVLQNNIVAKNTTVNGNVRFKTLNVVLDPEFCKKSTNKTSNLKEIKSNCSNMNGFIKPCVNNLKKPQKEKVIKELTVSIPKLNGVRNNTNTIITEDNPEVCKNGFIKPCVNNLKKHQEEKDMKAIKESSMNIPKLNGVKNNIKTVTTEDNSRQLRKKEPKYYLEESDFDDSKLNTIPDKPKTPKSNNVPIYRIQVPEEPQKNKNKEDLYEFNDFSPKLKHPVKCMKVGRKSSILFDKDMHSILQKIEAQELKIQKKALKKKCQIRPKKYESKMNGIMESLRQKIKNKNKTPDKNENNINNIDPVSNIPTEKCNGVINNNKIIRINNFDDDINVIVHCSSTEVTKETALSNPPSSENITMRNKPPLPHSKPVNFDEISVCDNSNNFDQYPLHVTHDDHEKVESCSVFEEPPVESHFNQYSLPVTRANHEEIDSCFGFNEPPNVEIPKKIKIINNVVLQKEKTVDSPQKFDSRRPNANSTMRSPWRVNGISTNPHFLSVKNNALPRIDQEMVLDHTLAEKFQEPYSSTPVKNNTKPPRKEPVQQSILDFIESNIEKENRVFERSLFDCEEFNSPVKKNRRAARLEAIKLCLTLDEVDIVSSTPVKRKVLGDITNSSEERIKMVTLSDTYFGFDDSSNVISPRKNGLNNKNNLVSKPTRFDQSLLKTYTSKSKKNKVMSAQDTEVIEPEQSISIFEDSEDQNMEEIHIFEEPEDVLDQPSPILLKERKRRRKRLDSTGSEASDDEKRRKKHKKTKLEIEQEKWIAEFNKECDEIDHHELTLE